MSSYVRNREQAASLEALCAMYTQEKSGLEVHDSCNTSDEATERDFPSETRKASDRTIAGDCWRRTGIRLHEKDKIEAELSHKVFGEAWWRSCVVVCVCVSANVDAGFGGDHH